MKVNPKGFWQALEVIPGLAAVEIEWRSFMGDEFEFGKAFLRPNGRLAASYPCIRPRGCGCHHEVIVHSDEDIVAVCRCESGCDKFALQRASIVVYELDRQALDKAIRKALGLIEESGSRGDLPGTTRIGVYSPLAGFRFPVYLTIQLERNDLDNAVDRLIARNGTPFILLSPTRDLCGPDTEKRLNDRHSILVTLSENLVVKDKKTLKPLSSIGEFMSRVMVIEPPDVNSESCSPLLLPDEEPSNNRFIIERRVVDDTIHWIMNGKDKGLFFTRPNSKKAKIIEVLYDQIGRGWIPHRTFMNACGWKEEEYFPALDNPGRMQRQLTYVRGFLQVEIEFSKDNGVRFADGVVKSRNQS